jgi:hypothetical protein
MRRIALMFTSLLIAGTAMAGQLTVGDWDFMGIDCFPTDDNTVNLGWTFEAEAGAGIEIVDIVVWDYGQYDVIYTGGGLLTCTLNNCPETVGADFVCDLPDDIFNHYLPEVIVELPATFCDYDCPDLPVIDVPTYSYDFGTVTVGSDLDWELVISNVGNIDLVVDDVVSDDAAFTEDFAGPVTIAAAGTYSVFVTFTPDAEAAFAGTLTLTSNAEETPLEIALAGMGAAGDVPDIAVDPMDYDFGGLEVGMSDAFDLVITNDGAADLVVSDIVATPDVFTTDFAGEVTIAPDASETYTVTFMPVDNVQYDGSLTITNNDQEVVVPLSGLGTEPDIYIPLNNHDYGEVQIGESAEWTCVAYNNGNADLIITETTVQLDVFEDDLELPATILPGESLSFGITFTPDASSEVFNTQLQLYTNDPADPTMVFLSGTAVPGAAPNDFALLTPANEATVEEAPVNLTWEEAVDPDGGDVVYTLFVSPTDDFGHADCDTLTGLIDTSYELTMADLDDDSDFFWRVFAMDGNSFGTYCDEDFSFAMAIPEPPSVFDLMAPPDGQNITLPQNFFWLAAVDPDPGDVITYLFQVSDDEGTVVFEGETEETNYTLDEDLEDGTYYWTVLAQDTNTEGTWASATWEFSLTVSVIPGMGIPEDFSISSVYPNPFNPQVTIVYAVPQPANITASVYDLSGRRVAQLHPGFVQPGYHEMTWQPEGATGIYFLRITADTGWSETRRMIYLK